MTDAATAALAFVRAEIPQTKREISHDEAEALFTLAQQYDGGRALEIGTATGYSAAVLARAMPGAQIVTLNPKQSEWNDARQYLAGYANVEPLLMRSWDYLARYDGADLDLVFVDGDHGQVARDFAWWDWLKDGGLMLFHDYMPEGHKRPCQPVYEALNALRDGLGRDFDVRHRSLAGWYKEPDEPLPDLDVDALLWCYDADRGWVRW